MASKKKPSRRQITGSQIGRLKQCPASGALPGVHAQSDAGELGAQKHRFVYDYDRLGRGPAIEAALPGLRAFCAKVDMEELFEKFADTPLRRHEVAFVWDSETDTAEIRLDVAQRNYGALKSSQIPMTLDVLGSSDTKAVIIDVKTGRHEVEPAAVNPQLRAQALAVARALGIDDVQVGIAYLNDDADWRFDMAPPFDSMDLAEIAEEQRAVVRRVDAAHEIVVAGGVPDAYPSDDACFYCPSIRVCPAKVGMVRQVAEVAGIEVGEEIQLVQLGAVRSVLKEYVKLFTLMLSGIDDIARQTPIHLPNGKWLRAQDESRESFDFDKTHAALVAAYGEAVADAGIEPPRYTKASIEEGLKEGHVLAVETARAYPGAVITRTISTLRERAS